MISDIFSDPLEQPKVLWAVFVDLTSEEVKCERASQILVSFMSSLLLILGKQKFFIEDMDTT
jgi:hypothetical protein